MKTKIIITSVTTMVLAFVLALSGFAEDRNDTVFSLSLPGDFPPGPECWTADFISYTGEQKQTNSIQAIQRISTYEIHDDDSVNPNHELAGLPYFETFTWQGSSDVEWLILDGNFSYYEIDTVDNTVTFYDLQDWLHVVYRTNNFIQRSPDQIRFCVVGKNGGEYRDTQVRVLYPGNYQLQSATPAGYIVPASGEVQWNFGEITEFMVDTYFAGLGPDRPLLDLPVDYQGRIEGSSVGFTAAFNTRTTSKFDHRYPNYSKDQKFMSYTGIELDDPSGVRCQYGFNCYDGHDAYDIDDRCPDQSPCSNPSAVFPAADGNIIKAGWLDSTGGCQIEIDHGGGWTTLYAHLRDSQDNHTCDGILVWSGHVGRFDQIGIIGESGSGADGTHLHFAVRYYGRVVDPSGWEPNPVVFPDPWAESPSGAASYPMWLYSIRTTQALDPSSGGQLESPTHEVFATIPAGFYGDQLMFNLSSVPVAGTSSSLVNTGHSFSLTALDTSGSFVHQLNEYITLQVTFDISDTLGMEPDTLSLYSWDETTSTWTVIPTTIDWSSMTATGQTDHLSNFALMGQVIHTVFLPITMNK